MKKSTYLCGYYGMQNSGDDALLWATLSGAKNYFNAEDIKVNSPNRVNVPQTGSFSAQLHAEPRFRGENRLRQCVNAFKANQIIFGGGSVLHCKRDMDVKYLMMKLAGKGPHLALGVGVESFANVAAEKSCARFLNRCDYVGVRDQSSYDVATGIAPNANVELTFDLAPSLLPQLENYLGKAKSSLENSVRRGIGVTLCPRESIKPNASSDSLKAELRRIEYIALCLTSIYRETGEPIFIFDMNGHPTLGDVGVHNTLQQILPADVPVFRFSYNSNPIHLIRKMSQMKATFAMRLHGSIFSYLAGTPVISLNYHNKCEGWCDQIGLDNSYRYDASNIDVERLTQAAITGVTKGFKETVLDVRDAFSASVKNFTTPLQMV